MLFKNKKKKETFDTNKTMVDLYELNKFLIDNLYEQNRELRQVIDCQQKVIKELHDNLETLNKLVSK